MNKQHGGGCRICPRECGALRRADTGDGFCAAGEMPRVAKAMLHMWEEPVISGTRGSGAVFFSGCPLACVYCQNTEISKGGYGKAITDTRLRDIYFELADAGAHNINLVNPTHYAGSILRSLEGGVPVPVIYNSGGYDSVDTLRLFEGAVQVYLPDMKYAADAPAARYSAAADYPAVSRRAILEMFRQTGPYVIGDDGLISSGVIIRHLILPGSLDNTRAVIDWVAQTFAPGDVLFSLMSQYTPCGDLSSLPELQRRLSREEHDSAMAHLEQSGIEDGFFQELSSAKEEYIPDFDLGGV